MTVPQIVPQPAPVPGTVAPAPWQATHIFYTANSRPVITECIGPLVDGLRADGLLHRHFFINYWLEGPHVRLRVQPSSLACAEEVRARVQSAITAFLTRRPALYDVKSEFFVDMYNTLFDLEFEPEERQKYLDDAGRMRQRDNNTFTAEPYEPEHDKYGGPAGVELAEWHFEHSSDLVRRVDSTMNVHVRSVLLGLGAQLMMIMTGAFIDGRERMQTYLLAYHEFWRRAFQQTALLTEVEYEKAYALMAGTVGQRFATIIEACAEGRADVLPPMFAGWLRHCTELRARVTALATAGELVFPAWDGSGEIRLADPDAALERLLSPYMHMTNNRLQVTLGDEAYLSLLLGRTVGDRPSGGTLLSSPAAVSRA
jgi:hypothetical protein